MGFSLYTGHNFIFVLLIIVLSLFVSFFYYRKTKTEPKKRYLLSSIRFLSIFFLLMLFLFPVLTYTAKSNDKLLNIFLIDNSQSLNIENRKDSLLINFKKILKESESFNSNNRIFLFSGTLLKEINANEIDSIDFKSPGNTSTNLSATIDLLAQNLSGSRISSLNIFSDGIINTGGNPSKYALEINSPVNFYLSGDTSQKKDLVVKDVLFNDPVFIESNTIIKANIESFGYTTRIVINLFEENNKISSKTIDVNSGESYYSVDFSVKSNTEGIKKYKVEIEKENDEITLRNNYKEFFIKFVDNKLKILVLGGYPSSDLAFLSETLNSIKNFEVNYLTQKSPKEYYEGMPPDLNDFRIIILIGYPTSASNPEMINSVRSSVTKNGTSLFFIAGRNIDYDKLSVLYPYLPFKAESISNVEQETGLRAVSLLSNEIFLNSFSQLKYAPKIFKTKTQFSVKPGSETILLSESTGEPVFVINNSGEVKSAAFLANAFYKWQLSLSEYSASELMTDILSGTSTAIAPKEKSKKFYTQTQGNIFSPGEVFELKSIISDDGIIGRKQVKVKIYNDKFSKDIDLEKISDKEFSAKTFLDVKDDYFILTELFSEGVKLESNLKRISISESNFEYINTKADRTLLKELSLLTGGIDLNSSNQIITSDKPEDNTNQNRDVYSNKKNVNLNFNFYFLFPVLLLLSLEWLIRKRNNLP